MSLMLSAIGLVAVSAAGMGSMPGSKVPQLKVVETKRIADKTSACVDFTNTKTVIWQNASAFGPVPKELQAAGDAQCGSLCAGMVARGFHPKAKNIDGSVIPDGGYFCVDPKKN